MVVKLSVPLARRPSVQALATKCWRWILSKEGLHVDVTEVGRLGGSSALRVLVEELSGKGVRCFMDLRSIRAACKPSVGRVAHNKKKQSSS